MARQVIDAGTAPILWSTVEEAFRNINQNFTEIYATIAEDLSTQVIDFSTLYSDVSPGLNEVYDLGAAARRWKDLYLSGSSIYLGNAVISANGSSVELPSGSTIGGALLDNTYFKEIAVSGQSNIVAESGGEDILTIEAGNLGIEITTDPSTDTLTISNSGVTSITGTAGQIGVNRSTGDVTITNLGVTSITAGQGVSVNTSVGPVTITNNGLIGIDEGYGITVSARDPITGNVTVTNSQPNIPQLVWNIIEVSGQPTTQPTLTADQINDTLIIRSSGDGLSITTNALTDTITFQNTGVTNLAVGNGLAIDAGTGSINLTLDSTLSRNIIGDVKGSVFGEDSTMLVDSTGARIVGDIETSRLRTSETKIALGTSAGETTQGADTVAVGNLAGRTNQAANGVAIGALSGVTNQGAGAVAVGSAAGNTGQGFSGVAIGYAAGGANQGQRGIAIGDQAGPTNQGDYAVAIGSLSGGISQGANSIAIGQNAGVGGTNANSIILNATGLALTSAAAGFYVDPIRSTANGTPLMYNTSTKELFSSSVLEFVGSTISTSDSSAVQFDGPVTFQTTVTADQGVQLNGVDAIIRSDNNIRLVPTNSVESLGAELTITGLDVMGEPNVIIETATDQGTIQIGGDNNNTASVTVRKSTGEVYVGGFWRFLADGGLYSGYLSAPPDSPTAGAFYVADGVSWDPDGKVGAVPYPVFWDGASYHALY